MGKYKQAIADYNEAIDLNPRYAEAYNNRGIVYGHIGDEQKAIINMHGRLAATFDGITTRR
jgi:tetratricopeptide (TPR) repeat protein